MFVTVNELKQEPVTGKLDKITSLMDIDSESKYIKFNKQSDFPSSHCSFMGMGTLFIFLSSHMVNVQWTKFEQKSIDSFISGELPQACLYLNTWMFFHKCKTNS